jgi:iron complex transport system ATP-binding protein
VILVTHHIHEIPPEIVRVVLLKAGCIRDDKLKGEVANEYSVSNLYSAPVELLQRHGWFQVVVV